LQRLCFEATHQEFWHGSLRPGDAGSSSGVIVFLKRCLVKVPPTHWEKPHRFKRLCLPPQYLYATLETLRSDLLGPKPNGAKLSVFAPFCWRLSTASPSMLLGDTVCGGRASGEPGLILAPFAPKPPRYSTGLSLFHEVHHIIRHLLRILRRQVMPRSIIDAQS